MSRSLGRMEKAWQLRKEVDRFNGDHDRWTVCSCCLLQGWGLLQMWSELKFDDYLLSLP